MPVFLSADSELVGFPRGGHVSGTGLDWTCLSATHARPLCPFVLRPESGTARTAGTARFELQKSVMHLKMAFNLKFLDHHTEHWLMCVLDVGY